MSSKNPFNSWFRLDAARKEARKRKAAEYKRQLRDDEVYGAALREQDRLRQQARRAQQA